MATMTATTLVKPDRTFLGALLASGGGDLKRCFQCATCSTVCELSRGSAQFPRKEMHWAQWGLKDRLLADPDVWLCHQCNDCSVRCPRGARPGDVLAAVRQQAVRHYGTPGFLGRWVNDARLLPVLLLVTAALVGLALLARAPVEQAMGITEHHGLYAAFFPHWLLNTFFPFFTIASFLALVVGLGRFWQAMRAADARAGIQTPARRIVASTVGALKSILLHDRFAKCEAQAPRRVAHLTAFYGFLALFVVTIWAVVDIYVNPILGIPSLYPFDLAHPMKVVANVGGLLLVFGCVRAIVNRRTSLPGASASTSFDWTFLWLLLAVGVTGFATEVFRFGLGSTTAGPGVTAAYALYFVHLVLVFQLLVYLPYSKFAHLAYRTVAMVYAEHTGRLQPPRAVTSGAAPALAEQPVRAAVGAGAA